MIIPRDLFYGIIRFGRGFKSVLRWFMSLQFQLDKQVVIGMS